MRLLLILLILVINVLLILLLLFINKKGGCPLLLRFSRTCTGTSPHSPLFHRPLRRVITRPPSLPAVRLCSSGVYPSCTGLPCGDPRFSRGSRGLRGHGWVLVAPIRHPTARSTISGGHEGFLATFTHGGSRSSLIWAWMPWGCPIYLFSWLGHWGWFHLAPVQSITAMRWPDFG